MQTTIKNVFVIIKGGDLPPPFSPSWVPARSVIFGVGPVEERPWSPEDGILKLVARPQATFGN